MKFSYSFRNFLLHKLNSCRKNYWRGETIQGRKYSTSCIFWPFFSKKCAKVWSHIAHPKTSRRHTIFRMDFAFTRATADLTCDAPSQLTLCILLSYSSGFAVLSILIPFMHHSHNIYYSAILLTTDYGLPMKPFFFVEIPIFSAWANKLDR